MVIPCGSRVSWGLAVNLAVSRGVAELAPRTRPGERPCVTPAGLAGGNDRQHAQVRQHEHTQGPGRCPRGERRHRCWVTAHVVAGCLLSCRHRRCAVLDSSWPVAAGALTT